MYGEDAFFRTYEELSRCVGWDGEALPPDVVSLGRHVVAHQAGIEALVRLAIKNNPDDKLAQIKQVRGWLDVGLAEAKRLVEGPKEPDWSEHIQRDIFNEVFADVAG
jgi:ribosomal protein L7/L12